MFFLIGYIAVSTSFYAAEIIQLEKYRIVNIGNWKPTAREKDRPADLWRYYMHGAVDHFATPIPFEALFDSPEKAKQWLDPKAIIDTPYKKSDLPAMKLTVNEQKRLCKFYFLKPLPIKVQEFRKKCLLFYFWAKADDLGGFTIRLTFKTSTGETLSNQNVASPNLVFTRGTFPWHCYYGYWFIPQEADTIYLSLEAWGYHGTVWFSNFSWEPKSPDSFLRWNNRQDPLTGSSAPNPDYDEMPELLDGVVNGYKWNFLLGKKAGIKGEPYDISTKSGYRDYYFNRAKKLGGDHLHRAVRDLPNKLLFAQKYNLLPVPLEEGWFENYKKMLLEDQDTETGFWRTADGVPSLGLTFHLVHANFNYYDIQRPDRKDQINEKDLQGSIFKRVPHAEKIVQNLLFLQSSYIDECGVKRKAAWCHAAYDYTKTPDGYKDKCWLCSTWDAIFLARNASRFVNKELQTQVYQSVKDAFRYVLHKCVQDDYQFKQHDTDKGPSSGAFMAHIVGDSSYLERKIDIVRESPDVTFEAEGEDLTFSWKKKDKGDGIAVRIYIVPAGLKPEEINEKYLIGVIHHTGYKIYEMDPFIATYKIFQASLNRFGDKFRTQPETAFGGNEYVWWKLRMINYPLPYTNDGKPLTLKIKDHKNKDIYVSTINWYGEESVPRLKRAKKPAQQKTEIQDTFTGNKVEENIGCRPQEEGVLSKIE